MTYIKLYRELKDWEWYKDSKMVHLFIHLLLSANFKPNKWQGIDIKKGQILTGLNALNKQTGISVQSLRTCIKRLKSTGELTIKSTNKFSLITLLNWEHYQGLVEQATSTSTGKLTNDQQTTNNQSTTPNKDKKVNNEKNKTPIPPLTEFLEHGKILCKKANIDYGEFKFSIEQKYETWVQDGWIDGNKNKIKIWKTKLGNVLPHLKAIKQPEKSSASGTIN